jgi:hypothetical protein
MRKMSCFCGYATEALARKLSYVFVATGTPSKKNELFLWLRYESPGKKTELQLSFCGYGKIFKIIK